MVFLHVSVLYLFSYLSLAYGRMNMLSYVNDNHMKPIDSNYISQQLSHPATATDHTTLNDVRIAAESGGHIFCPLIEQSWACTGQNYTQLLVDISPFDALNYGMQMVKHGTFVYGEGGSHIAQLLLYWACSNGTTGGNEAKVYKLPSNLGTTTTESALGTDYFIHIPSRDATFLFLFDSTDNAAQHRHNNDPCGLMFRAKYLREKEPERVPSIIVLGDFDDGSCLATDMVDIPLGIIDTHQQQWKDRELAVRHGYYTARFPSAHIIQPRPKSDAGGGILSYFQQCIPGPLVREAELLAADIIEASHQPVFISPATTLDTSQYGNPLSRFSKEPLPSKANLSETLDKYYGENVAAVLRTFESTSSVSALVEHRRDPAHAWNTIRGRGTFVWAEVAASAKAGGHEYCTVSKDLWVCSGERYISVLLDTAPFDASRYSIDMVLPNNGVVLIEGNSHMAEVVYYMACETHAADIWKPSGGDNDGYIRIKNDTYSSSIFLFDNDKDLNSHPNKVVDIFDKIKLKPNVIVLGHFNNVRGEDWGVSRTVRRSIYQKAFPAAHYVVPKDYIFGGSPFCAADMLDCHSDEEINHHRCFPGPIARIAEQLAANISFAFKQQRDVYA